MANTYTWADLITYSGVRYPRMQSDAFGALMCDQVHSLIWAAADWRVSLKVLPPFFLVPLEQDYVAPFAVIPADFLGLRSADLVYNGTEPATRYPPLHVDRYLPITYAQARPDAINYEATIKGFRVHPRPPNGIGPMDYQIEGKYKANPVKVTAATLMNTLPFDDQYFSVYANGLAVVMAGKPRDVADWLNVDVARMAASEAVNLGDQNVAPSEPLVGW